MNMMTDMLPCPCGSAADIARTVVSMDARTQKTFTYRICGNCSLERVWPRPGMDQIGAYYESNYAPHVGFAPNGIADRLKRLAYETFWAPRHEVRPGFRFWRPVLRLFLWPIRYRTILAFKPPHDRRIFEFGAARATDLLAFKAAGWEVSGCEPSKQACDLAAAQGVALQNTTAEDAVLAADTLGCILLNNVFEHIHDPVAVLAKCHRALKDGGVLMLIVPNHQSPTAKLFGSAWPGYDAPRHLWGWTPKAMRRHLSAAGFEVSSIHHQATGAWLWRSTLDMTHAPGTPGSIRRWLAAHAAHAFVPISIAAALLGHGDFMRIISRKVPVRTDG